MKEYEFTLKFSLPYPSQDPDSYIDRLAEEGCEDAVVGVGRKGRISLQFDREANDAFAAILSALKDVRRAIPDARFIGSEPDLVGLSDIAEIMGFSRQNMRKIMLKDKDRFPPPIYDGNPSLWHLSSLLTWLKEENGYPVDESLIELSRGTMYLNIVNEAASLDSSTSSELSSVLA